jgi:hypothetical protein
VLVGAAGCLLIGIEAVLAVRAARLRFLRQLDTGTMNHRTKQTVTAPGVGGGVACGVVFAATGISCGLWGSPSVAMLCARLSGSGLCASDGRLDQA